MWSRDFKEFVALLNAHRVEYLVVGGYAVGLHGAPRFTGDLDIWVGATQVNAERLLDALKAFGFGGFGLTAADFTQSTEMFQMGEPPFRIDVLTAIDGVRFEDCHPRRVVVDYDGVQTAFIAFDDLVANKTASGRDKDRLDLAALAKLKPTEP